MRDRLLDRFVPLRPSTPCVTSNQSAWQPISSRGFRPKMNTHAFVHTHGTCTISVSVRTPTRGFCASWSKLQCLCGTYIFRGAIWSMLRTYDTLSVAFRRADVSRFGASPRATGYHMSEPCNESPNPALHGFDIPGTLGVVYCARRFQSTYRHNAG